MTGRQKIEAAFSENGTPEIPAVFCYEGIFVRDHWKQLNPYPWWYNQAPDIEKQMSWRREMIRRTRQDWLILPMCYPRRRRQHLRIEERGEEAFLIDSRTGRRDKLTKPEVAGWSVNGGLHSVKRDHLAKSLSEIDELVPVYPGSLTGRAMSDGRYDLASSMLEEFGADLYPIRHVSSPLWCTYQVWGFEGMMTMIAERPDLVRHACRRFLARSIRDIHEAADMGATGIWIEECMTDMISPDAFASLCVPFVRSLVDEIRSVGMESIYYFCGDPAKKLEHLLSVGADALSLEESKKGFRIDISEVAQEVKGRCALLGNLDAINLLPSATEEQLRAEIIRQIDAGRQNGNRFIMSLGSPVTPGTTVKRVRLYCDLVHELGTL